MNLKFGDKITFDTILKRVKRKVQPEGRYYIEDWRVWESTSVPIKEGIVIGRRTLWDGTAECEEGWNYFVGNIPVPVYLVAFNLSQNPVYIPIENYNKEERNKVL